MRIILANPVWSYERKNPPYHLAELAAYVKHHTKEDIHIIDLNTAVLPILNPDEKFGTALNLITELAPDLIGFSALAVHLPFCEKFIPLLKKKYSVPVVLGGVGPTFMADYLLKKLPVDFIVRGEGEETLVELISAIKGEINFNTIKGLSYASNGVVYHNPDRELVNKLDHLPFPAFDLLYLTPDIDQTAEKQSRIFTGLPPDTVADPFKIKLTLSRGCIYQCRYCSSQNMWQSFRQKSIKRIFKEIDYLINVFKSDHIYFYDDCLSANKKWFFSLMQGLSKRNLKWGCLTRIDEMDDHLLETMKQNGCICIYYGIESGSDRIRKILGKHLAATYTPDKIISTVQKSISLGIDVTCSFMGCAPSETIKDLQQTAKLSLSLQKAGATVQYWLLTPYPGIPLKTEFEKHITFFDKWKQFRLYDVFSPDQFILFYDFFDSYEKNLDKFLFKPAVPLDRFLDAYISLKTKLGHFPHAIAYGYFVYHYFKREKGRIYFIDFDTVIPVEPSKKQTEDTFLLRLTPSLDVDDIEKRIIQSKSSICFISPSTSGEISQDKYHILIERIIACNHQPGAGDKTIYFTKPLPEQVTKIYETDMPSNIIIPKGCHDCLEMFHVDHNDRIVFCFGKKFYPIWYATGRKQLFSAFLEFSRITKSAIPCPCITLPLKTEKRNHGDPAKEDALYNVSSKCFFSKNHLPQRINPDIPWIRFSDNSLFSLEQITLDIKKDFWSDIFYIFNLKTEEIWKIDYARMYFLYTCHQIHRWKDIVFLLSSFLEKQTCHTYLNQFLNTGVLTRVDASNLD